MKGVHWKFIIYITIGIIAMSLSLYVFRFIFNFDSLFLSNDQRLLKQYSTCALAYCAAGAGSDEVQAVGCLKYVGGSCNMTCTDVKEKIYDENNVKPTVYEVGGRGAPHYCGSDANLTFQFSGVSLGGTVPLTSGQMDKIATQPQWVCKPIKIPFTNIEFDSFGISTADAQFHGNFAPIGFIPVSFPQNCIILSGKVSPIFPGREGCFLSIKYDRSYDDIYYTPLIEYNYGNQINYPSAVYLDSSFTRQLPGSSSPECDFRNSPDSSPVTDQQILDVINKAVQNPQYPGMPAGMTYQQYYDQLGSEKKADEQKKLADFINSHDLADLSSSGNLIGNVLSGCKFKTQYNGKKVAYHVWAKPVYPPLTALATATGWDGFTGFVESLLKTTSKGLGEGFGNTKEQVQNFTTLAFSQLGGSCTSVILGRDLPEVSSSNSGSVDVVQDLAISTDQKTYPAGGTIKFSGQLVMKSGSAIGKEITVDYIYPTLNGILQSMKVLTDNDGKFSGEFKIPSTGGGTGFILQTSFLNKKVSSDPFNIGG